MKKLLKSFPKRLNINVRRSSSGDWVGIYVNGELKIQNHEISEEDVIRLIMAELPDDFLILTYSTMSDKEFKTGSCTSKIKYSEDF